MYNKCCCERHWCDKCVHATGSMTPFMLRLLDAELPLYCRDPNTALDRLFLLKECCEKVCYNIMIIGVIIVCMLLFVAVIVAW